MAGVHPLIAPRAGDELPEPDIWASVRNGSPLDHTPIVGQVIFGVSAREALSPPLATYAGGSMLAW